MLKWSTSVKIIWFVIDIFISGVIIFYSALEESVKPYKQSQRSKMSAIHQMHFLYLHGTELQFAYSYNKRASTMFTRFSCQQEIEVHYGERSRNRNERSTIGFSGHWVSQTTLAVWNSYITEMLLHLVCHQVYRNKTMRWSWFHKPSLDEGSGRLAHWLFSTNVILLPPPVIQLMLSDSGWPLKSEKIKMKGKQ